MIPTEEQVEAYARTLPPEEAQRLRRGLAVELQNARSQLEAVSGRPGLDVNSPNFQRAKAWLRGAGMGAATGFALGGPVGGITGAAAGGIGELAENEVQQATDSPVLAGGAGLAADLGTTLALRRPSGGLLRRAGANRLTPNPTRRAATRLASGGLLEDIPEGAPDVVQGVLRRHRSLSDIAKLRWNEANRVSVGTTVPVKKIKRAAEIVDQKTKGLTSENKSQAMQIILSGEFGDHVTLENLQTLLSQVSDDVSVATMKRTFKRRGLHANVLRDAINESMDDIARTSPDARKAVEALRDARAATARLHKAIPEHSAVFRRIVDRQRRAELLAQGVEESPEAAMVGILTSGTPVAEVELIKKVLADEPAALRGLKRVAINRIWARVSGSQADAGKSVGAALAKAQSKEREALAAMLGEREFRTAEKLMKKVWKSTRGTRSNIPEVNIGRGGLLGPTSRVAVEAGAAGALLATVVGADATGGFTVGVLAGSVISEVAERYGPRAARILALEAIQKPEVMRTLVRKVSKNSATTAEKVLESAIRRGVIEFDDMAPVIDLGPGGET